MVLKSLICLIISFMHISYFVVYSHFFLCLFVFIYIYFFFIFILLPDIWYLNFIYTCFYQTSTKQQYNQSWPRRICEPYKPQFSVSMGLQSALSGIKVVYRTCIRINGGYVYWFVDFFLSASVQIRKLFVNKHWII